jgi:uncharacterized membrane protein YdjX (TVP38/TMEM64 family)
VGDLPRQLAHQAVALRGSGLGGALTAALGIVVATLLLVPVVPLVMLAGWIFGPLGALVALPAATLSAALAFSASRALGRTAAVRALRGHPRIAQVVELAERGGLLTVALLRLAPVVPFTPGNLALGLTELRLADVLLGTPLGMAPGALVYLWIGALLPDPSALERGEALQLLLRSGGLWPALLIGGGSLLLLSALLARRLRQPRARLVGSRRRSSSSTSSAPAPSGAASGSLKRRK